MEKKNLSVPIFSRIFVYLWSIIIQSQKRQKTITNDSKQMMILYTMTLHWCAIIMG